MSMLSIDQVYKNVIQNGFTYVKIFDSENSLVGNKYNAEPLDINNYIRQFIIENPGLYSFEFKKSATASKSNTIKAKKVNCMGNNPIPIQMTAFDHEEERRKIREQIKQEEIDNKAKIDYHERLAQLDTATGALEHVITKIFMKFVMPAIPKGNLQGNLQSNSTMAQTTTNWEAPVPLDKLTKEQLDLNGDSLHKIMQIMSPELFNKIATEFYNNPQKIQAIKAFM